MRVAAIIIVIFCLAIVVGSRDKAVAGAELLDRVREYRQNNERRIVDEFIDLLSIPNVSADKENTRKNAVFITQMLQKRGLDARLLETPGNPLVYGELNVPQASRTLLFYVHYDGQPVEPAGWIDSQPFKPVLRPAKMEAGTALPKPIPLPAPGRPFREEWRLYGRSTGDDKAPILCILTALDAIKKAGVSLRNNIKFILDGEEEAGSPNLGPCLARNKSLLKADVLFMCDGPAYFSGDPTLFFGVRGIVSLEITVYGPNVDLHSGHYGNWAPNPALHLAQLLASMKDRQGKVLIPGFYDTVVPLSAGEIEAVKEVPGFDAQLMALYGFAARENPGLDLMAALQLPALNIDGIRSGSVGEEARTVIPSSAAAAIDIRLVKGNEPAEMVRQVIAHVRNQGYHVVAAEPTPGIRAAYPRLAKVITSETGYPASRTSMDLPISRSIAQAFRLYPDLKVVMLPSLGGSLPIYLFDQALELPVIGVSIANYDNNQHQANENIRIGHLWRGIEIFAALLMLE